MTRNWPQDAIFTVGHSTLPIEGTAITYPPVQGSPF